MILVVLLNEILEDAAGLKEAYLLTIPKGIRDSRNSPIRVDLEEPRFFLSALADINVLDFVGLRRMVSIADLPSWS